MAKAAGRLQLLDQGFKRNILMGVGIQASLTHSLQQLAEGLPRLQAAAQHQRVDEKADQFFSVAVAVAAVGDGRADTQIILAAVAG